MKNLIALETEKEINDFVLKLWKSDIFHASHRDGGYIQDIVQRFAYLPRLFAETSNDHLERPHFATWWNVIMLRDYENPIIHDLYYLHEMTHAASMPYVDGIGVAAFNEKMQRNELEASVLSEIAVYFDIEGLRESSFPHTIYADRFLNDQHMCDLWVANRQTAIETLRTMRRDVMVSKPESHMDLTEIWIRRFADQNNVYASVWADRYSEIEMRMALFQKMATADVDGARKLALHMLQGWLEKEAAKDAVDNIPFRLEAELFAPFYWANKAKYDAAMAK